MSDDDDFMQESDGEYDFEYEDDDDEPKSGEDALEKMYYEAKEEREGDADAALAGFAQIPVKECADGDKGEWGFKALKQMVKLTLRLGRYADATAHFAELLTYVKSAVSRNYSEGSINRLLDHAEKTAATAGAADAAAGEQAARCTEQLYDATLACFQATNNERLWLKTNIKVAKLLLDRRRYGAVAAKLEALHAACRTPDGADDPGKGTYLLEMYALEIQMHAQRQNNKGLKRLYQRALAVKSAVPHPKIMGIIRECGGKMHMAEENWAAAQSDFFESFRNYDEAGSLQRIQVLKYVLLSTMLMGSQINPFDSQETKPYRNDPRITAMTELVDAYQHGDIKRYEAVLAGHADLLHDTFIAENIDEVTRSMRTNAILKIIQPYTRMLTTRIADQIRISDDEVQDILGHLIVSGRVHGAIDQQTGVLELGVDAAGHDGDPQTAQLALLNEKIAALTTTVFDVTEPLPRAGAGDGPGQDLRLRTNTSRNPQRLRTATSNTSQTRVRA